MIATAVQLPFRRGVALSVGPRMFRKQILPRGTAIEYKGRKIEFDDAFLADLATAFNAGAYDQVPFLLAPGDNSHTMDPERFRGQVKALELADDGLYGVLELSAEGSDVVTANPSLGVSARIVEGLAHADGRLFPRAIQHVLGTLDPRVTGMKPWEPLNLSNPASLVDLTAARFADDQEELMPEGTTTTEITAEDRAKFDAYLTELGQLAPAPPAPGTGETIDPAFEAELQKLLAEGDALVGAGSGDGPELSAEQRQAIELANAQSQADRERLAVVEGELAEARFEKLRGELVAAGVPPAMVELAKPLLTGTHVIELSATEKLDATETVRKLLEEAKGTVDLSAETPGALKPSDEESKLLTAWEAEYPAKR